MLSLVHSEGIKHYPRGNDTFSTFPSHLSDPYAYPSNLYWTDYNLNLFYAQNTHEIQKKRKKKSKEHSSSEKCIKENAQLVEPGKDELIEW